MILADSRFQRKVESIYNDVFSWETTKEKLINKRLDATFSLYLQELEYAYDRLLHRDSIFIIKELGKGGNFID